MSHNILNDISKVYLEQVALDEAVPGRGGGSMVGKPGGPPPRPSRTQGPQNPEDSVYSDEYREKQKNRNKARFGPKSPVEEALQTPKRWWDDDGDGVGYENGEVSGKFKKKKKTRVKKESFSNWRDDLSELMEVIDTKKIKEKKKVGGKIEEAEVDNTECIKINPNLGEAIEELGGTLLEMVEVDEIDFIIESAYVELLDEGYEEDVIEYALEYALTEAKVTFGHDTSSTPEKKKESLLSIARKKLSGVKKAAVRAVARGARGVAKGALGVARKIEGGDKTPNVAQTKVRKPSTYRGAGAGKTERVSSGSYTPPTQKKTKPAQPVSDDPWQGSATAPKPAAKPAAQPAAPKPEPIPAAKASSRSRAKPAAKAEPVAKEEPATKAARKRQIDKRGDELLSRLRGVDESKAKFVDEDLQPETPQQISAQNLILAAQKRLAAANQSSLKKKTKPTQPLETSEPTG